jgi:sialate O-acetylesterase
MKKRTSSVNPLFPKYEQVSPMARRGPANVLSIFSMRTPLLFLLVLSALSAAHGNVTLPPLISDNMLLQNSKAAVWGKANPGEKITAKLGKISAQTTAGKDGKWRVMLEGLTAGIAGDLTVSGNNTLTVKNVAVGDVWFCSGQSNMEFPIVRGLNAPEEIASASFPNIRMFTVERKPSDTPIEEVGGHWDVCIPQTVPKWSAVGYFFGRKLHHDLGIPIGLIHSSWGGTPAQAWTPESVLQANAELDKAYNDSWKARLVSYPADKENYDMTILPAWRAAADAAKAAGNPIPRQPAPPKGIGPWFAPGALYNGMILGATAYSIKGVIWYQGEANVGDAVHYRALLPAMVGAWREAWGQDFPFLIVQIANNLARRDQPGDSNWADLRDSQRLVSLTLNNSALAVALDLGEAENVHFKNKQEVGRRLALAAEAKVYGKELISSGPQFDKALFEGGRVTITFKPGTAPGLMTTDGQAIKGFALAGDDRKFVWADARIVAPTAGEKDAGKFTTKAKSLTNPAEPEPVLLISSPAVAKPVAVRYAWANNPEVNLVNKDGLPASSFRSDDWPQNLQPLNNARKQWKEGQAPD